MYECSIWTMDGKVSQQRFSENALVAWMMSMSKAYAIDIEVLPSGPSWMVRLKLSLKPLPSSTSGPTGPLQRIGARLASWWSTP